MGGPECTVIHVLSCISTTFLIDLITFPMTESKIETTSELTGVGSVFDVPGASLVAQQDRCLHERFFFPFLPPLFSSHGGLTFGTLLTGFGLLPLQPELVKKKLEGGQQGRGEFNRDVIFQGLVLATSMYGLRELFRKGLFLQQKRFLMIVCDVALATLSPSSSQPSGRMSRY